jgi:hypothetical protein
MENKMTEINFESRKNKKAHAAWIEAIDSLGGTNAAAHITGIVANKISSITHGYTHKMTKKLGNTSGLRKQCFPTIEQAMKICVATKLLVEIEDLLPNDDFDYLHEYISLLNRKGKVK